MKLEEGVSGGVCKVAARWTRVHGVRGKGIVDMAGGRGRGGRGGMSFSKKDGRGCALGVRLRAASELEREGGGKEKAVV